MLDRGAARPSTVPVPGPRAGRCAAPAPRTANARRDPGPIIGRLRRLGWGRVHDASRPGGSGAGTARRRAPRPAFSGPRRRTYSPGVLLAELDGFDLGVFRPPHGLVDLLHRGAELGLGQAF